MTLPIGTKGESTILVTNSNAISFLGDDSARVLGTPYLIGHLEMTARDSVQPYLDEGYDTVGVRVDVRHLAATPLGMRVTFRSELTGIEERRLHFKVEAFDDKEKIGEGTHERAIINIAKFTSQLKAKASGVKTEIRSLTIDSKPVFSRTRTGSRGI
ncbi:MAG TPA: thioesterase family protein [Bryobacteraceae bacterium]|nr:thioesterase family protein [Bryobacteraceae bacterium]